MTLMELLTIICQSDRAEWNVIFGTDFRHSLGEVSGGGGPTRLILAGYHHTTAVYMPDIDITMSFGMEFENQVSKGSLPFAYADVFYRGSLVLRIPYQIYDDGRALLPYPEGNECPKEYSQFACLLDSMEDGERDYNSHFQKSGLKLVDVPWRPFNNE